MNATSKVRGAFRVCGICPRRGRPYQSVLAARGLRPLLLEPAEQEVFDRLLYQIKLGVPAADIRPEMSRLARSLTGRGADVLIAACTEVPLVLGQADVERRLVDATLNLALRCVRYARRLEPIAASCLRSQK